MSLLNFLHPNLLLWRLNPDKIIDRTRWISLIYICNPAPHWPLFYTLQTRKSTNNRVSDVVEISPEHLPSLPSISTATCATLPQKFWKYYEILFSREWALWAGAQTDEFVLSHALSHLQSSPLCHGLSSDLVLCQFFHWRSLENLFLAKHLGARSKNRAVTKKLVFGNHFVHSICAWNDIYFWT